MRSGVYPAASDLSNLVIAILFLCVSIFMTSGDAYGDRSASPSILKIPGIKGDDNRVRVRIADYPWRMIGRLNRNGSHCTGILVGPSAVLTAAHCFWDSRQRKWSVPSSFHFVLGYERGEVKAHSKIDRYELADGKRPSKSTEKPSVEYDWAIAHLKKPLGEEFGYAILPEFSLQELKDALSAGSIVIQSGFSRDIAHILTADEDCLIRRIQRRKPGHLLLHQCDATRGDSGSPLFLYDGQSYFLIGIHVATILTVSQESEGVAVSLDMFREQVSRLLNQPEK